MKAYWKVRIISDDGTSCWLPTDAKPRVFASEHEAQDAALRFTRAYWRTGRRAEPVRVEDKPHRMTAEEAARARENIAKLRAMMKGGAG